CPCFYLFFLFQAEDGIRARNVTGVQTCALPISTRARTFNSYFKVLNTVLFSSVTCCFGSNLRRKRSTLTRTTETSTTRCRPRQYVVLAVRDGNYGVVDRCMHVGDANCSRARNAVSASVTVIY